MDRSARHPGGRPPLDETDESVSVHVRVPARQYDRVYAEAQQERLSVPEYIRRRLPQTDHDEERD